MRRLVLTAAPAVAVIALAGVGHSATAQEDAAQAAPPEAEVMTFPTPEASALIEEATRGALRQDLVLRFRPYYFPSFQGGSLVMVGFRVGSRDLLFGVDTEALAVTGGIQMVGGMPPEVALVEVFGAFYQGGERVDALATSARLARGTGESGLTSTYSFGASLPAGSYEFFWGVRDLVNGKASTVRQEIEVPEFGSALRISSVLMVEGAPTGAPGAFVPGAVYPGVRVMTASFTDLLVHEFPRDGAGVMLTYVVAGAARDAATGSPHLELNYRILDAAGASIWRAAPQAQARNTVGQTIPFADIEQLAPDSDYVFVITARDLVTDAETTAEVAFRIVGE